MTAVLAIAFPYQVLVFGDCRVTWQGAQPRLQDNLQKLYQLGPTGVVGFAGGVAAAKALFALIRAQPHGQPLPASAMDIAHHVSRWARESYRSLKPGDKVGLELLYAAADYARVGLVTENLIFAQNVLATMMAPDFQPTIHADVAALGYANTVSIADVVRARDDLIGEAAHPFGIPFQAAVAVGSFGEALARLSGEPVGGLFTVAVADARGVTWHPYAYGKDVGLSIIGRRFIQFDNRVYPPRAFPLKGVWQFDARHPASEDLYVPPPTSRPPRDSAA